MPITNATLAAQLNELLQFYDDREAQFAAWMSGAAGGGDYANGTFLLTDRYGTSLLAKSPAQLEADVDGLVASASASATAASASATAAALSETNAGSFKDLALGYKDDSIVAQVAAEAAQSAAENAAANILAMLAGLNAMQAELLILIEDMATPNILFDGGDATTGGNPLGLTFDGGSAT